MFQIGALSALEDTFEGLDASSLDLYLGTSSGASLAAALAGGQAVQRIYRAFLDPADSYFSLERKHLLRVDLAEWRRAIVTGLGALRHGGKSVISRGVAPPAALFEELDRFYDSLPAGLYTLDHYERFLADYFVRRGVPNSSGSMPRPLIVTARDLDTGEEARFGEPGLRHVPVSRACIASMAIPPFFSPVRIGDRHFIDGGPAQFSHFDIALEKGADVVIMVNPMVPVRAGAVPTGHGRRPSVRDKGMLWVVNQSLRIGMQRAVLEAMNRGRVAERACVMLLEPDESEAQRFMYNPTNYDARRGILEYAYRSTKTQLLEWYEQGTHRARTGWRLRTPSSVSA
jgi:predicted acylesterase/phospholipase RssA